MSLSEQLKDLRKQLKALDAPPHLTSQIKGMVDQLQTIASEVNALETNLAFAILRLESSPEAFAETVVGTTLHLMNAEQGFVLIDGQPTFQGMKTITPEAQKIVDEAVAEKQWISDDNLPENTTTVAALSDTISIRLMMAVPLIQRDTVFGAVYAEGKINRIRHENRDKLQAFLNIAGKLWEPGSA